MVAATSILKLTYRDTKSIVYCRLDHTSEIGAVFAIFK